MPQEASFNDEGVKWSERESEGVKEARERAARGKGANHEDGKGDGMRWRT
jgi:hypothetical protein